VPKLWPNDDLALFQMSKIRPLLQMPKLRIHGSLGASKVPFICVFQNANLVALRDRFKPFLD